MSVLSHQSIQHLSSPPVRIDGGATLDAAARLMGQRHIGSLVVDIDGQPAGLITDRDVALAALRRTPGTPLPTVSEVASMPLLTLPEDVSIEEVARFFGDQCVRRAGLVSMEGELVGVLSSDSVLTFTASLLQTLAVGIERGFAEENEPTGRSSSAMGTE